MKAACRPFFVLLEEGNAAVVTFRDKMVSSSLVGPLCKAADMPAAPIDGCVVSILVVIRSILLSALLILEVETWLSMRLSMAPSSYVPTLRGGFTSDMSFVVPVKLDLFILSPLPPPPFDRPTS